jgi:hypothetical protein
MIESEAVRVTHSEQGMSLHVEEQAPIHIEAYPDKGARRVRRGRYDGGGDGGAGGDAHAPRIRHARSQRAQLPW